MNPRRLKSPLLLSASSLLLALLTLGAVLSGCRPDTLDASGRPDGKKLYHLYCEGCHGPDGKKGDAERDFSQAGRLPDDAIRAVIRNGQGKMPPMKDYLKDEQITAIIRYVRSLPAHGSASPAPPIAPDEKVKPR